MSGFPQPLPHPGAILPRLRPGGPLFVGGIWGTINEGQTILASDGERLIWRISPFDVIYSQRKAFFIQKAIDFASEVRVAPAIIGAIRAKVLVDAELKVLIGIVAGTSSVGFWIVIGSEVTEFVIENREKFDKWRHQFWVLYDVHKAFERYAPTFYHKVIKTVLVKIWEKVPEAITPNTIGFAVGVVVGHMGQAAFKGHLTPWAVVGYVAAQVATRFVLNVVPDAVKFTQLEYSQFVTRAISMLREQNVQITSHDMDQIIREFRAHGSELREVYEALRKDFGSP
jgi:hypothetical protein